MNFSIEIFNSNFIKFGIRGLNLKCIHKKIMGELNYMMGFQHLNCSGVILNFFIASHSSTCHDEGQTNALGHI